MKKQGRGEKIRGGGHRQGRIRVYRHTTLSDTHSAFVKMNVDVM